MSFIATLYPEPDTEFKRGSCHIGKHGRAFVALDVGALRIQSNCWEDAQRLVDALNEAISAAKHAEETIALAGVS